MNQDNVEAWVQGLRSGKYNQGFSYLHTKGVRNGDELCCLGVACEVYRSKGGKLPVSTETLPSGQVVVSYGVGTKFLPQPVREWLGFEERLSGAPGIQEKLAKLNDISMKNFDEIADFIEKELKRDGAKNKPQKHKALA